MRRSFVRVVEVVTPTRVELLSLNLGSRPRLAQIRDPKVEFTWLNYERREFIPGCLHRPSCLGVWNPR